ncbi:MAG: filamentous hemagglutinin N-terminal domain-containing protein, partial [Cyanobacteria bacterium J06559_3]
MRGFVSAGVALGIGIGLLSGLSEHASAQVIPDNTLGAEDSELVPRQEGGLQIEGGAVRGESLFHSFAEFSIDAGEIIYFANPAAIETILGRVTGEVRSDILGTLGVDGTASLYLINPNGIVFGPDAQLDIAGSLFVSAAPSLDLGEGISFSAVEPTTIPLLTVSVMPGLPLGQDLSGEISSNEATLRVGDELTLAAGKIELEGGLLEADGDLFVGANQLFLRDGASILSEAGTEDGGNITIEVGSLTLEDGASIASNTLGTGRGGDLTINASESITLQSSDPENFPSFIGSSALEGAGDTGSVNVTADTLFLDDGSYILNDTFSESTGNAGDLSIDIRRLVMDGDSIISSSTYGEGNGGVLTIRATESIAMNSSIIEAIAYKGTGDADDVSLTADELFLDEGSFIWSETLSESTGNAGDLTVDVRRLVIEGEPRSIISSSTCGEGDGGALVIRSTESVLLNTGSIWAAVFEGTGNAGDLSITADELLL